MVVHLGNDPSGPQWTTALQAALAPYETTEPAESTEHDSDTSLSGTTRLAGGPNTLIGLLSIL